MICFYFRLSMRIFSVGFARTRKQRAQRSRAFKLNAESVFFTYSGDEDEEKTRKKKKYTKKR